MTFTPNLLGGAVNFGPAANMSGQAFDATVADDAVAILVPIFYHALSAPVTGVDIEGEAATLLKDQEYGTGFTETRVALYGLLAPPTGASVTFTVTQSSGFESYQTYWQVWELRSPASSVAWGATAGNDYAGTGGTAATVSVTTTADNSGVFAICEARGGGGAPFALPSNDVDRLSVLDSGAIDTWTGIMRNAGAAGSKTVSLTLNASQNWAMIAQEILFVQPDDAVVEPSGPTYQSRAQAGIPTHDHPIYDGDHANLVMVATLTFEDSTDPSTATLKYGDQDMTAVGNALSDPGSFNTRAYMFYLDDAGIAAADDDALTITFTGGTPDQGAVLTSRLYRNMQQGGPTDSDTDSSTSNNGTGLTPAVDEYANGLIALVGFHGSSAAVTTPPSGYSEVWEYAPDTNQYTTVGHSSATYDKQTTAADTGTGPDITWAAAQRVGIVCAAWHAAQTATGAYAYPMASFAGAGTHTTSGATGSGAFAYPMASFAGTGAMQPSATGAYAYPMASFAGVGVQAQIATGAFAYPMSAFAGVGIMQPSATGAWSYPVATFSGVGVFGSATATGGFAYRMAAFVGNGVLTIPPTGTGGFAYPMASFLGQGLGGGYQYGPSTVSAPSYVTGPPSATPILVAEPPASGPTLVVAPPNSAPSLAFGPPDSDNQYIYGE